ncbi:MAG: hypothetical protein ISR77_25030 [Pirellulaceae bacterium]|nr:hypothetical protein [Pirellulaceae bacterium]
MYRHTLKASALGLVVLSMAGLSHAQPPNHAQPRYQLRQPQFQFGIPPKRNPQTHPGIIVGTPKPAPGTSVRRGTPYRSPGPSNDPGAILMEGFQRWLQSEYARSANRSEGTNSSASRPSQPPVPTADQVARLSDAQLRELADAAIQDLQRSLARLNTGPTWTDYLQLEELDRHVAERDAGDVTDEVLEKIRGLGNRYDQVSTEPKYQRIHRLWGFHVLHALLPELSRDPMERRRTQLASEASTLKKSLGTIRQGTGWNEYLQLDDLERISSDSGELRPEDQELLKAIKERFEEVERNRKYEKIAGLFGFKTTRDSLEHYVRHMLAEVAAATAQRPTLVRVPLPGEPEEVTVMPLESGRPAETTVMPLDSGQPAETTVMPLGSGEPAETTVMPLGSGKPAETTVMPLGSGEPAETTVMPLGSGEPAETTVMPLGSAEPAETTVMSPSGKSKPRGKADPKGPLGRLKLSKTGKVDPKGPLGKLQLSETGKVDPKGPLGKLQLRETGDADPKGPLGKLTLDKDGKADPKGPLGKLTLSEKDEADPKADDATNDDSPSTKD